VFGSHTLTRALTVTTPEVTSGGAGANDQHETRTRPVRAGGAETGGEARPSDRSCAGPAFPLGLAFTRQMTNVTAGSGRKRCRRVAAWWSAWRSTRMV